MAYTLGDPFRPLRLILRLNGVIIGLLLGVFCLLLPGTLLIRWGLAVDGALWLWRLAGANLCALGCFLLIAAGQDLMHRALLFTATLTHVLWAVILFMAYLQQELVLPSVTGQLLFVCIFVLCLLGAVLPLRYVRSSR